MLVLDLIVIIIIVSSFLIGYKKGLVNIATSAIGFLIALILSFTLNSSIAEFLKTKTPIFDNVNSVIEETIRNTINKKEENPTEKPKEVKEKNSFLGKAIEEIKIANGGVKENLIKKNAEKISNMIIKTVSFMITYILVILIVDILSIILNGIFSLPLLDSINNIGGSIVSGIVTFLKTEIVLVLIKMVSPISAFAGLISVIDKTVFIKALYNNNVLFTLWTNIIK